MKRRLAAILACALAVSTLAACGETKNTGESIAEATIIPGVELVETQKGALIQDLPVEDYVELGDYKKLSVEVAPKVEYTDEEKDVYVKDAFGADLQAAGEKVFETKGTVAEGDYVWMDFEGKKDGVAFDGGTAEGAVLLIGSDTYIDGFEDGLIGVSVGKSVDLNLTFPENYDNADLAGKAVVFTVKVRGIAQLEDAAVAALGYDDIATVDDYTEAIVYIMEYEAENEYNQDLMYALTEALLESCKVTKVPSSYFEEQQEAVIAQVQAEASGYGVTGDAYTQAFMGVNLADYALMAAEEYSKQAVIFQAIANAEDLCPTEEEIDKYVADFIELYGEQYDLKTAEDFYKYYTRENVRLMMTQENVINFLAGLATITDIK